eukprot:GAHX01001860.1.p1 GENE.GAHX01001860.1~~GAHX01001860.1.p1  ORF type:complete len:333 (-),score=39.91 GAHX01001860.1:96-1094(-)
MDSQPKVLHRLLMFLIEAKDQKQTRNCHINSIWVAIFLIEHIGSSQTFITLRELYYILFQRHSLSYSQVSCALDRLCKLTFTPREQYQIVSGTNLFVYGDLVCSLSSGNPFEQTTFKNFFCSTATLVPSSFVLHFGQLKMDLNTNIRYLVIIEKHSVLDRISQFLGNSTHPESIKARQEILFCSGKGFASLLCKKFICLLLEKYPHIKPFIFTDADPHGFLIYLNYKLGNKKQCKKETFVIENLKWLGLSSFDNNIGNVESFQMNLKTSETKIIFSILKRKELMREEKIHLLYLLKVNKKIEIESLFETTRNGEHLLVEHIIHKIRLFEYIK